MSTSVQAFLADPRADHLIEMLATFIETPGNETCVRAAALALVPKARDGKNWRAMTTRFRDLSPSYAIGDEELRRYIEGQNYPRRRILKARVALLCTHMAEENPLLLNDPFVRDALHENEVFKRIETFLSGKTTDAFVSSRGIDLFSMTNKIFDAFQVAPDNGKIRQTFFGPLGYLDDRAFSDTAYYVMFRYSAGHGRIVKTFLALKSPAEGQINCFSFAHVYNAGRRLQKRVTRGPVVNFDKNIYLAGLSSPSIRGGILANQGVELITFPDLGGQVNPDHALLTGLFLSHGVGWKPIVGRLAMVQLGFRSELEQEVNDEVVQVKPFRTRNELLPDLQMLDEKFNFSLRSGLTLPEIESYILDHINNMHKSELTQNHDGLLRALTVEDGR
jgi:hypothetical protein